MTLPNLGIDPSDFDGTRGYDAWASPLGYRCLPDGMPTGRWCIDFIAVNVEPQPASLTSALADIHAAKLAAATSFLRSSYTLRFGDRAGRLFRGFNPVDGDGAEPLHLGPIRAAMQRFQPIAEQRRLESVRPDGDGYGWVTAVAFGREATLRSAYPLDRGLDLEAARVNPTVTRHSDRATWRMLWFGNGLVAAFFRTAVPDRQLERAWAFPLNWPVATALPASVCRGATRVDEAQLRSLCAWGLSDVLADSLGRAGAAGETPADAFDRVSEAIADGRRPQGELAQIAIHQAAFGRFAGLATYALLGLLPVWPWRTAKLAGAVRGLAAALRGAIPSADPINERLADVLEAATAVSLGSDDSRSNPWFGGEGDDDIDANDLDEMVRQLRGSAPPTLRLPDSAVEFDFVNDYASRLSEAESFLLRYAHWLRRAGPTIQFVQTLDLAAAVYALTIDSESSWYALSGLASSEGDLGSKLRRVDFPPHLDGYRGDLAADLDVVARIFRGVTLAQLVAFVWRQGIADTFLASWARSSTDADLDCVREVFYWMRGSTDRDVLDKVLGKVSARPDADGLYWRVGGGIFERLFERDTTGARVTAIWGIAARYRQLQDSNACCHWELFLDLVLRTRQSYETKWYEVRDVRPAWAQEVDERWQWLLPKVEPP